MNKDDLFRAIMFAMVALLLWSVITRTLAPPPPPAPSETETSDAVAGKAAIAPPSTPSAVSARGAESEQLVDLGNVEDRRVSSFALHLQLSNRGASLVSAHLTGYDKEVDRLERYELLAPLRYKGSPFVYSFTTKRINFQPDDEVALDEIFWNVEKQRVEGGERVTFWLDLLRDEKPYARLSKTYLLQELSQEDGGSDVLITIELENLSDAPLQFTMEQYGPVGVRREAPRMDNRKVSAAEDDGTQVLVNTQVTLSALQKTGTHLLYDMDKATTDLSWLALGNKFFGVIVAPQENAGAQAWVLGASAIRMFDAEEEADDANFTLRTVSTEVQPGTSVARSLDCFLGPKSKKLFNADPKYTERNYVHLIIKDYYWCAFTPIVNVMLGLLNFCHDYIPPYNYGVAIIFLVIIVRSLLHPLTKKGQVNMTKMSKQMGELQPKMEDIRKRHANDKTRMNQEMMKLYQQEGVNPAGQMLTCLPMMFQMPVWGGLWAALNYTVEMRHQPFFFWIRDLTAPDALFTFDPITLPLMGEIGSFNLLPPLLGIGMFLQQRLMPKPAAATRQGSKGKDQMAQQRMIMTFMSVFMVFIFYNAPAGLTLYIMASNFFGLFEQHRIRKHIKNEEEKAKTSRPVLDKQKKKLRKPKFLEKLEKMADEAKKQTPKKGRG